MTGHFTPTCSPGAEVTGIMGCWNGDCVNGTCVCRPGWEHDGIVVMVESCGQPVILLDVLFAVSIMYLVCMIAMFMMIRKQQERDRKKGVRTCFKVAVDVSPLCAAFAYVGMVGDMYLHRRATTLAWALNVIVGPTNLITIYPVMHKFVKTTCSFSGKSPQALTKVFDKSYIRMSVGITLSAIILAAVTAWREFSPHQNDPQTYNVAFVLGLALIPLSVVLNLPLHLQLINEMIDDTGKIMDDLRQLNSARLDMIKMANLHERLVKFRLSWYFLVPIQLSQFILAALAILLYEQIPLCFIVSGIIVGIPLSNHIRTYLIRIRRPTIASVLPSPIADLVGIQRVDTRTLASPPSYPISSILKK